MPNRILKDSICTSPNIDRLTVEAEIFFYRLIVQCDDFGRMDARPAILRARCYPLRTDRVAIGDITDWVAELVQANIVTIYTVDNQEYLHMTTWERHQQVRAKRSKYPQPLSSDISCNQMIAIAPVIQSNPIQSESVSESESKVLPVGNLPPSPSAHQEMFGAIVETCELDPNLKRGMIAKNAKLLLEAGYTPEQVRGFKAWWLSDRWRAEHTPVPSIVKLTDQMQQFRNGHRTGPGPRAEPTTEAERRRKYIPDEYSDVITG